MPCGTPWKVCVTLPLAASMVAIIDLLFMHFGKLSVLSVMHRRTTPLPLRSPSMATVTLAVAVTGACTAALARLEAAKTPVSPAPMIPKAKI